MINKVVECQRVDGVIIDEAELQALGDMIKEAGVEEFKSSQKKASNILDPNPMSHQSISRLAGDENDLLGDSPLFDKPVVQASTEVPMDIALIDEIEEYLKGAMEENETVLEFANSEIGSAGAKCIAASIPFFDTLNEIHMASCKIGDEGAIQIFEELKSSRSVTLVDLSQNLLTEKCFASLGALLK